MVGAGIVAGGPMMCAKGSVSTALTNCMSLPSGIDLSSISTLINKAYNSGNIDSLENLEY